MMLSPGARKIALTVHVVASLGWFGAVVAFLALAISGLASPQAQSVRAAYLAMALTGWSVIVPFAVASTVSGIISSVGTTWGLFRHYWVIVKLAMTLPATLLLLLHMGPIDTLAGIAATTPLAASDYAGLRGQLVFQASAALVVLLTATILSIYKPRGMTRHGRARYDRRAPVSS